MSGRYPHPKPYALSRDSHLTSEELAVCDGVAEREAPGGGEADDGGGQRVGGAALHARRQPQQLPLLHAAHRLHVRHLSWQVIMRYMIDRCETDNYQSVNQISTVNS